MSAGATAVHERELAALVRRAPGMAVLTGGQTGVDTLAARAALRLGLPVHLVFPRGFRQEDGRITAYRRRALRGAALHELSSASFRYRTWTAVYLADAVVLLDPAGGEGCAETATAARRLGRPLLQPPGPVSSEDIAAWLELTAARVLMVAGCRASVIAGRRGEPEAETGGGQDITSGLQAQLRAIAAAASDRHAWLLNPRAGRGH